MCICNFLGSKLNQKGMFVYLFTDFIRDRGAQENLLEYLDRAPKQLNWVGIKFSQWQYLACLLRVTSNSKQTTITLWSIAHNKQSADFCGGFGSN